jgi:HK97 family phage prohead protease
MELTEIKTAEQFLTLSVDSEKLKQERAVIHYISTPDVDLARDVVDPKGMDSSMFDLHKTVFYNHNYNYPIAKNTMLKANNDGVKAKTVFAKSNVTANDLYNLVEEDIIKTWSIGFDLLRNSKGELEKDAVEYDDKKNITRINKWRLIEYSLAPLAMNPNALVQAKTIIKSADLFKEIIEAEEKNRVATEIDYSKEFGEIKSLIAENKTASETEIEKLNKEISNLKNKFVNNDAVKTTLDKGKLLQDAIRREFERTTGRKYKK